MKYKEKGTEDNFVEAAQITDNRMAIHNIIGFWVVSEPIVHRGFLIGTKRPHIFTNKEFEDKYESVKEEVTNGT